MMKAKLQQEIPRHAQRVAPWSPFRKGSAPAWPGEGFIAKGDNGAGLHRTGNRIVINYFAAKEFT